jgi:hypothetical protein
MPGPETAQPTAAAPPVARPAPRPAVLAPRAPVVARVDPGAGRLKRTQQEHPYASVGIAFAVGAAVGIVKEMFEARMLSRPRQFFAGGGFLSSLKRRWT